MALLANAMSSLSLGAVASPSGLGFRKAVAAFTPSARVGPTSRGAAVFQIFATQNKKARTLQVRQAGRPRRWDGVTVYRGESRGGTGHILG
jgi:hypothetical protein